MVGGDGLRSSQAQSSLQRWKGGSVCGVVALPWAGTPPVSMRAELVQTSTNRFTCVEKTSGGRFCHLARHLRDCLRRNLAARARTLPSSPSAPRRDACPVRPRTRAPVSPTPAPAARPDLLDGSNRAVPLSLPLSPRRLPAAPAVNLGLVLADLAASEVPTRPQGLPGDACLGTRSPSSARRVILACYNFQKKVCVDGK